MASLFHMLAQNWSTKLSLAIGRSEAGIPWTGKGELARLIFLLGVPERLISDYLVVVGAIARVDARPTRANFVVPPQPRRNLSTTLRRSLRSF